MKKIAIGAVLVGIVAIAIMGFGPKYSVRQFKAKLEESWQDHSEQDIQALAAFNAIVAKVGQQNPQVLERFPAYKEKLEIDDEKELVNFIFLLRRHADKTSFYAGLEKWAQLSEDTQSKIIANFKPTYDVVAKGQLKDNIALLNLTEKRATNLAGVVAAMPQAFKDTIVTFEPSEIDEYLDCLHELLKNTIALRKVVGEVDSDNEEL